MPDGISSFGIASQRRGAMVAGIQAETAAIVSEIELVVLVCIFHLGRIESQGCRDTPIRGSDAHGGLEVGFQVGLGTGTVLVTLRMDVVA